VGHQIRNYAKAKEINAAYSTLIQQPIFYNEIKLTQQPKI